MSQFDTCSGCGQLQERCACDRCERCGRLLIDGVCFCGSSVGDSHLGPAVRHAQSVARLRGWGL